MRVSIVTYHTPTEEMEAILNCLDVPCVTVVDVVDNGEEERIARICEGRGKVTYIPSENRGYGSGHNKSIAKSVGEGTRYHLVINSDLEFDASILEEMTAYMDANPGIGLLHPRIIGEDGKDQWTARGLPRPADLILRRFMPGWMCRKARDRYLLKHIDHGKPFDAGYVQGSFMLLRTSVLKEVGVFDERFFMYPEDIDLSRRVSAVARVVYYPYATVVHRHRRESYESLRMTWIHVVNMVKYFNKWGWFSPRG